jgi:4-hydroxybenzoate polyprenyltransferase
MRSWKEVWAKRMRGARQAARTAALKLEAAWWMTRMHMVAFNIWYAVLGWVLSGPIHGQAQYGRLIGACLFVALLGGGLSIVNDILDAPGDAVTAPYLPLPAGLLRAGEAWMCACALVITSLAVLFIIAESLIRFMICIGLVISAALLIGLYSRLKQSGIVASVVIAIPVSLAGVISWILAGAQHYMRFAILCCYFLLITVAGNISAALRDVDLDGKVGNLTVPVRIGGPRAFELMAMVSLAAFVPVFTLDVGGRYAWLGASLGLVGLAIMLGSYRRTLQTFRIPERGRVQRYNDLWWFRFGEEFRHIAIAAAYALVVGITAGIVLFACLRLGHALYSRRLISGRLAQRVTNMRVVPV